MTQKQWMISRMTSSELNLAVDWAAAEGWNPGSYDAECFLKADPQGFFIGYLNDEPIASISAVTYDSSFGFIGLYIVKPSFRAQGWGLKMWQAAIEYLGTRNIGLDGVVAQQENYQKSGFKLAHRHIRYQGLGFGVVPDELIPLSTVAWEEILAYDSQHFPVPRPVFLKHWIQQPEIIAFGVKHQGELRGYGVLRVCRQGYKIGPLFADNVGFAELLLQGLMAKVPDATVFLDVPDTNLEGINLAEKYRMKPVFETARMYTLTPPTLPLNRVFGVTTLELG
ncbi:GNAT family N-acetyltransferase [Microcoleus sp. F6_B4]